VLCIVYEAELVLFSAMMLLDTVILLLQLVGVLLVVGGLAYHFYAVDIFNALVPKDQGTERVARQIAYGSHKRQRFDLYRPTGQGGELPVVVFVHGGGWDSGRGEPYAFAGRAFAAQGYLTAVMTYRIAPKNLFPDFVIDVALAIREIQKSVPKHDGDPSRVYLVGHSAGGYSVLQAVLDSKYFEDAGVDPKIIKAVATLSAPADFYPFDAKKSIAAFGRYPRPEDTQPVNYARGDAPPILLLHGSSDTTVGPHNSKNLLSRIKAASGDVHYIEYTGTGHVGIMLALAKPFRTKLPVLNDILTFFACYK
jgi:acetyl esterase/lipase